jgi:lipopolysaccharide/colanic/teichoic acid biosynthesis glycosyltransferase
VRAFWAGRCIGTAGEVLTRRAENGDELRAGLPRPVEVVLAFAGLVATAPLLAVSALAVALSSRGPVLFHHERVGRSGRRFRLLKFRTMRHGTTGLEISAADDVRITPVGRVLRRTKLDELPQLWNVVRGDMSLVGPRPEVPRYVDANDPLWAEVLDVRPGLTDPATLRYRHEERLLASVSGDRDRHYRDVVLPAKLRESLAYLRRRSWRTDLSVLLATFRKVARPNER